MIKLNYITKNKTDYEHKTKANQDVKLYMVGFGLCILILFLNHFYVMHVILYI